MKRMLYAVLVALLAVACNSGSNAPEEDDESGLTKVGKGKYGIKSGIVEYKTQIMGFDAVQTLYFEGYGEKESTVTSIEMMGVKTNSVTVTKEGFMYNFDPDRKTGSKTSMSVQKGNIDFENLTEEIMVDMKIQKVGTESFLDKPCIKYSIDNASLSMKGFYWVWKGIPLKTDVDMGGMKMLLEAVTLKENAAIPANQFDIPADIKFE